MSPSVSRRELLRTGAGLVIGFSLGKRAAAQAEAGKSLDPAQIDSFLAIHPDGSVTLYTSKVDVGTGMRIAIPQMAAEELGVPVGRIRLVEGDTSLTADTGGTGGSTGLTRGGTEIRQAAATARMALLGRAAERLRVPASELTIADGQVRPIAGGKGIGIGELLSGKHFELRTDPKAALQPSSNYQVVGKPLPRPDVPGKCTGKTVYLQDFVLPGMLHARVIRPPAIGASLLSVDEASLRGIPDVQVVRSGSFLGVVAKDEWAAIRAARELKAVWSDWQGLPGSEGLEQHLRRGAPERTQTLVNKGDSAAALSAAAKRLSATYWWPLQSHASLAPSCAVADVRPGGATVWSSTQSTHGLRNTLTKVFGLPAGKTRVVFLPGAGSYGGNGNDDAAADAVLLSKTVGHPVRVQWMRHDEHGWDPKGPAQLLDLRGGLDAQGRIVAWETEMWLPASRPGNRAFPAADAAGIPQDHGQGAGQISQNGDAPYAIPHQKVTVQWLKDSPLRLSNLRAPGKIGNAFAVECFTDELAAAARTDALAFRLSGLDDPRAAAVIRRATEMIGWQPRPSPNPDKGTGRGLAYVRYKQAENYVAIAMEVAVDRATGRVEIRRVTCAHDCGLIVNPDALRNQIEGCILQTLSRALHEEVKFDRARVTTLDWASYPILTFPEVPRVEVALLNHPELPLLGAGEAATAPVAAALGNAIFDATGVRLRVAPFTRERVRAGLAPV